MATAADREGAGPERAYAAALADLVPGDRVTLSADESGHLVRARRAHVGDPVVVFDGRGTVLVGTLTKADRRCAEIEVEGPAGSRAPGREVRVASAIPEAGRADQLVSTLAELGVAHWQPLRFARSVAGRDDLVARRQARFARLGREALKVNGAAQCLEIGAPEPLHTWLAREADRGASARWVFLDLIPSLPALQAVLPTAGALPTVVIGPEGGFIDEEREALQAAGAIAAGLGRPALRIETAALAAAATLVQWAG